MEPNAFPSVSSQILNNYKKKKKVGWHRGLKVICSCTGLHVYVIMVQYDQVDYTVE